MAVLQSGRSFVSKQFLESVADLKRFQLILVFLWHEIGTEKKDLKMLNH